MELDVPESEDGVAEGAVEGLFDGPGSLPMLGQWLFDVAAMFESLATTAGAGVVAAVLDEFVAACAC